MELLGIDEGKDLCTLITCTPYGVNSHRLLVQGERMELEPQNNTETLASAY
jgi:sortase A